MKIAIEGCCHGELDNIYEHIRQVESQDNVKVDLLLICGDFQAVRNVNDMQCMAVPDKYKDMKDFHKYYSGQKKAPMLTIIIGGNHEASNYMWELYHGGWLAPNIYFLGHAGVINVNGIRIAGASGIFKPNHFNLGHYERMPYNSGSIRSIYHIREYSVRKLSLLSPRPDVFLSHDWPHAIEQHGDLRGLLRHKPFLKQDISTGTLGSPPLAGLLHNLQPHWWFSAHLHTRFEARVVHEQAEQDANVASTSKTVANPDEIAIDDEEEDVAPTNSSTSGAPLPGNPEEIAIDDDDDGEAEVAVAQQQPGASEQTQAPPKVNPDEITLSDEEMDVQSAPALPVPGVPQVGPSGHATNFLALDKCLPRRRFIEFIDIDMPQSTSGSIEPKITCDLEWLAISRAFHPYLSLSHAQTSFPSYEEAQSLVKQELDYLTKKLVEEGWKNDQDELEVDIRKLQGFVQTAPAQQDGDPVKVRRDTRQPPPYTNPQTVAFCELIGVQNKINAGQSSIGRSDGNPAIGAT